MRAGRHRDTDLQGYRSKIVDCARGVYRSVVFQAERGQGARWRRQEDDGFCGREHARLVLRSEQYTLGESKYYLTYAALVEYQARKSFAQLAATITICTPVSRVALSFNTCPF